MTRMFLLCAALVVSMEARIATAYEPETHREIAIQAAQPDGITDRVLKDDLDVKDGVKQVLLGQRLTLQELVGEGAFSEDSRLRYRNHFHNPLLPWDRAGLDLPLFPRFQSSVVWQQNRDQDGFFIGGGNWSWQDARQRYLAALTGLWLVENTREQRDLLLADTFRTLGHLTHMVQDASVPAHSRNDSHFRFEGYESWAEGARTDEPRGARAEFLRYLTSPAKPSLTIFAPGRQEAPIPIARLVDSDKFDLQDNFGPLLDPALGIAEYSNGNFLSDGTIFRDFTLPRRESLDLNSPFLEPVGSRYQRYFPKVAEGQRISHFVAESALYKNATESAGEPISDGLELTRLVYRDYAAELLPRAVGYSAALLDYFFRGKLEATIEADPADSEKLQLTAKNASSEPLGAGTLTVYGDYAGGERRPLGSWPIQGPVAPGVELPRQSFSPDRPVPERYMVVYQGSLGEEKKDSPPGFGGAVIGKAAKYVGILEQLFINQADGDVYFRNGTLVARLNVQSQLRPGSLLLLRSWGTRNDTFLVEGAVPSEDVSHFYVFTLNRPRPDQVFRDPPVATLVRGPELVDPFFMRSQLPPFARPQVLNYLAILDDNLNVILHGDYCLDIPDPFHMEREECHALVVNHTARTILFDLSPSALGAPSIGAGFTWVFAWMVLRLDASNPGESRIVVDGHQNLYANNDSDRGYLGIVDGNGRVVTTLMGWEPFRRPYVFGVVPQRGGRHLLWVNSDDNDREGNNTRVYLSSLVDGTSTEIGAGIADILSLWAASLLFVAPDHLLRIAPPTYFVKGWTTDGTVVLPRVGTPGFPPEDPDLASLNRLADAPPGVSFPTDTFCGWSLCSLWQVIEDPDMLR